MVQVFVSDKKRSKEFGGSEAFNRIKKEMVKEMKGLGREEQVLVMGCSAAPHICVKKDEKAFMGFFDKHIYLPLPDYASRLVSRASYSCGPHALSLCRYYIHTTFTVIANHVLMSSGVFKLKFAMLPPPACNVTFKLVRLSRDR